MSANASFSIYQITLILRYVCTLTLTGLFKHFRISGHSHGDRLWASNLLPAPALQIEHRKQDAQPCIFWDGDLGIIEVHVGMIALGATWDQADRPLELYPLKNASSHCSNIMPLHGGHCSSMHSMWTGRLIIMQCGRGDTSSCSVDRATSHHAVWAGRLVIMQRYVCLPECQIARQQKGPPTSCHMMHQRLM